jgi:twitching motility protein PilT
MNTSEIDRILQVMLRHKENVSDLHFYVNRPPQIEVDGSLYPVNIPGLERLSPFHLDIIARTVLASSGDALNRLETSGAADFSYSISAVCRFRVNVYRQRGTLSMVMRVIPFEVPTIKQLQLPEVLFSIVRENNGIVLVTGPTGSGKSTTIAAILDEINNKRPCHIVTIEDPIEYLHNHRIASICQRELGADTTSFAAALRDSLRQAPKVIVVGEMRDTETAEIALEAAETGHLVFSTLHTIDASKAIDRILGIFPKSEQDQVRNRFAQAFRFVLAQRLVPKKGGGRILAMEILKSTRRTREYIIKGEAEDRSLVDAMKDGVLDGMQTFDQVLEKMVRSGIVDKEVALRYATNANNLAVVLQDSAVTEESISWRDMLEKESFDIHDIYRLPNLIKEMKSEAGSGEIKSLVGRILEYLNTGETSEKVGVLKVLSSVVAALSAEQIGQDLSRSTLNFVRQSIQQEEEQEVLLAYTGYFRSSFLTNLENHNYSICKEILQSAAFQMEGDPPYQNHFAAGLEASEKLICGEINKGQDGADAAIEYLRLCGEKGAELIFRWLVEEQDRPTRIKILNYIGRLDPPQLSKQIEKHLDDYRWYVVRNMITVLTKSEIQESSQFLQHVADHQDMRVAKEVLKKLYSSHSPEDNSLILRYLQHGDRSIRVLAVNLVTVANVHSASPYLLRLLGTSSEKETDLRAACFTALTKLRVREAATVAQKVLERKPSSRDEIPERNAAVKLLGELAMDGYSALLKKVASGDSFKETREVAKSYFG